MQIYIPIWHNDCKPKNTILVLDGFKPVSYQNGMTWLRSLRTKNNLSQAQLAELAGTSQPQIKRLEDGERKLTKEWAERLAPHLHVSAEELLFPPRMVPLVGYVGAGSLAHYFGEGDGNLGEVEAPENASEKTVGVEIRGESLGIMLDGWVAYYDEVREAPTADMIGKLCVVGLYDGRVLIKKLEKGQLPKHYNLLSQDPPIYDAEVTWAAVVKAMMPRS
ncbi:helix-turn-helix domain-containing protein [Microvirga mediterraneensis]|nr:helix-turn-helix transcriptional regulator [Microvirga mediterraneensis]